jgi:RNA polymerase sigma-70 factor (ECF subfamily)
VDTAAEDTVDAWVAALTGDDEERHAAQGRLHGLLLRVALHELGRRAAAAEITGPERADLAHQATADAMLAILAKLPEFRGESRFTTWAYKFVVLEVSSKLGRHYWRRPSTRAVHLEDERWERFEDTMGLHPEQHAEGRDLAAAVRRAVDALTDHQRELFVAIVVDGVPLDAMVERLGTNRNAIYQVIFGARRKIRAALVAEGYLDEGSAP